MIKTINYALGSKSYFNDEITANPDRRLVIAENLTTEDNYILIDLSDKTSIFGSSIQLETLYNVGDDLFDHFLFLQAFDLDDEKRAMLKKVGPKVLDDTIKNFDGRRIFFNSDGPPSNTSYVNVVEDERRPGSVVIQLHLPSIR